MRVTELTRRPSHRLKSMLYSRSARCCRTLLQRCLLSIKVTPKGLPKASPVKSLGSPPISPPSLGAAHNITRVSTPTSPDTGPEDAVCLHRSRAPCPPTANPGNNAVQLFQHPQRISTRYCSVSYTDRDTTPSTSQKHRHFTAEQQLQAHVENQLPNLLLRHLPSCQAHSQGLASPWPTPYSAPRDAQPTPSSDIIFHPKITAIPKARINHTTLTCFPF